MNQLKVLGFIALLFVSMTARAGGEGNDDVNATPQTANSYKVPDLPGLGDAKLTIPWESLRGVLTQWLQRSMERAQPETPPVDYILSAGRYRGRLEGKVIELRADYELKLLKNGWISVPLLGRETGLLTATLDNKPAPMTITDESKALIVKGPAQHRLQLTLVERAPAEPGVNEVRFRLPEVADANLLLDFPARLEEVEVNGVMLTKEILKPGRSGYSGLAPTGELLVRYTVPAAQREEVAHKAKVAPRLLASCDTLISIEEAGVRSLNLLEIEVRDAPVTSLTMAIPKGYSVAEVTGTGVLGVPEADADGVLKVPLNFELKGAYHLRVVVDKTIEDASFELELPIVTALSVEQQKGHLGIQVTSGAEVAPKSITGLVGKDSSELPGILANEARSPILLAYAYRKAGFQAVMQVRRHMPIAVLDAAVDEASLVMQLTEDGQAVTRAIYTVRNNNRQFMRFSLPKNSQVWSSYVGGRPVKPAADSSRKEEAQKKDEAVQILIPLERSVRQEADITSFEVELIFYTPIDRLTSIGNTGLPLPTCDLPVSQMFLTVFLPEDRLVLGFGGELQPLNWQAPTGLPHAGFGMGAAAPPAQAPPPQKSKDYEKRQRLAESQFQQNVQAAQADASRMGGLTVSSIGTLPTRFTLPQIGQTYRFRRLVALPNVTLTLSVVHAPDWLASTLWLMIAALGTLLFWKLGAHLWQVGQGKARLLRDWRVVPIIIGFAFISIAIAHIPMLDAAAIWALVVATFLWFVRKIWRWVHKSKV